MLTRIKIDQAAIDLVAAQGFSMDDVRAEGTMVKLTLTGRVGLDIAGIDFMAPDITQPVRETGGAICEVNAAPGFRMHTHPTIGDPQYVAKPVIDTLLPPGKPSRIPIVAVTGTNGKTTTARIDVVLDGLCGSAWPSQAARSVIPLMITAGAVAGQSYSNTVISAT